MQDRTQIPLATLAWPIVVENLLRTSLMSVDTFMLSRFSQNAVAAMSLVGQFAFFIQLLYMMAAVGASILISQNLGAQRHGEAGHAGVASLALTVIMSIVVSAAVALLAAPILALYHLDPQVNLYARQFLTIFGGLSLFMAFNIGQASILRAWGHPRDPMVVNTIALILTVCGDALCLFGPFGFPVLGVAGVAASTVVSQIIACILFAVIMRRRKEIELPLRHVVRIPRPIYKAILAVGVPTAGETLAYNVSQIIILSMIATMGTEALATYGILNAVLRYVSMPGISIGSATQIKVGYLVGAGRQSEAKGKVYRYFAVGFVISLIGISVINLWKMPIVAIFTPDQGILRLSATILLVGLMHEPGRNFNTIINPALKGSGDVRFPVVIGVSSMLLVSTSAAWLLGIGAGLGLLGVWIAMCAEEWLRGIVMALRWRSGAWVGKSLVGTPREAFPRAAKSRDAR